MSGGGTGRGSGRAHFRSKLGCCICGTKSSSSRFTASERYAEHFGPCFGEKASKRSGDLCNACVLCVKRWLGRGKQEGYFSQVLDSKQGPGPKHMKEITKRARRREARQQQAAKASTTNRPSTSASSTLTNNGAAGASRGVHAGHHNHHPVHHSATCVACWADQNNSNSTPVAGASVARTRSAVARKLDTTGSASFGETSSRSGLWTPTESSGQVSLWEGYSPHNQEFRPPRPPSVLPGNGSILSSGGGSQGVVTRAAASASVYSSLAASGVAFFDGASSTASSTTSTPSTPTRRQNRRTRLPPVKISSDCVEVHDILQKIQKANQAMNLDNRQINMAMQREIRLRNRTVNPPVVAAAAASSSASSGVGVDRLLSGGGSGGGGGSADTSLVTGSSAAANAADLRI
uniref:Protein FAM60A n=1 Tax=Mesocestoides corti TaxID=53468 RepID=A0A5K3F082_MESCO